MSETGSAVGPRDVMSQALFNRLILAALTAGLIVLVALAATAFWLAGKARDYSSWVDHTYVAQSQIIGFEAKVEQAETARRGYLLAARAGQFDRYTSIRQEAAWPCSSWPRPRRTIRCRGPKSPSSDPS